MSRHKHKPTVPFSDLAPQKQKERLTNDAMVLYHTAMQAYHIFGVYQRLISAYENKHPTFQECGCFWSAAIQSMYYTTQMHLANVYEDMRHDTITLKQLLRHVGTYCKKQEMSCDNGPYIVRLNLDEHNQFKKKYSVAPFTVNPGKLYVYRLDNVDQYIAVLNIKHRCVQATTKKLREKRNQFLAHHIRDTHDNIDTFLQHHDMPLSKIQQLINVAIAITTGVYKLLTGKGLSIRISNHDDVRYILSVLNTPLPSDRLGNDCCG